MINKKYQEKLLDYNKKLRIRYNNKLFNANYYLFF